MTERLDAATIAALAIASFDREQFIGQFKLHMLFQRGEWESFDVVQRRLAGKIFKKLMRDRTEATALGPNTTNHQRYEGHAGKR